MFPSHGVLHSCRTPNAKSRAMFILWIRSNSSRPGFLPCKACRRVKIVVLEDFDRDPWRLRSNPVGVSADGMKPNRRCAIYLFRWILAHKSVIYGRVGWTASPLASLVFDSCFAGIGVAAIGFGDDGDGEWRNFGHACPNPTPSERLLFWSSVASPSNAKDSTSRDTPIERVCPEALFSSLHRIFRISHSSI